MKDHKGDFRGYHHLAEAWYSKASLESLKRKGIIDEVTFGFYCGDGGTSGEMAMRWYDLNNNDPLLINRRPFARLECFEDAFHALGEFSDVIEELSQVDEQKIQPKEFCALLDQCGFRDLTARDKP